MVYGVQRGQGASPDRQDFGNAVRRAPQRSKRILDSARLQVREQNILRDGRQAIRQAGSDPFDGDRNWIVHARRIVIANKGPALLVRPALVLARKARQTMLAFPLNSSPVR